MSYGDLGCTGQTHFTTPNLDRLAAGGIPAIARKVSAPNINSPPNRERCNRARAPTAPASDLSGGLAAMPGFREETMDGGIAF
jgi:hypothetical protein